MIPDDVLIFPQKFDKGDAAKISLYKTWINTLNIAASSKGIPLFGLEIFKKESVSNFLGHPVYTPTKFS
jgi:hypothetical protein